MRFSQRPNCERKCAHDFRHSAYSTCLPRLSTLSMTYSREPEVDPIPWARPVDSGYQALSSLHLDDTFGSAILCHALSHIPPCTVAQSCLPAVVKGWRASSAISRTNSIALSRCSTSLSIRIGTTRLCCSTRYFPCSLRQVWWIPTACESCTVHG
jgi:hypothetical protein